MKVGGTRKPHRPAAARYGEDGAGDTIPPNATLTFEVECLSVSETRHPAPENPRGRQDAKRQRALPRSSSARPW